ncbi:MAG: hypothetical protein BWZ02_03248 [Lentisphaerae bacterium ADurb.BinA184]|nr:MAG: hypothetical protein BWZ02_03248 [Lentisphaerae bacterium ADurb.BinA184]
MTLWLTMNTASSRVLRRSTGSGFASRERANSRKWVTSFSIACAARSMLRSPSWMRSDCSAGNAAGTARSSVASHSSYSLMTESGLEMSWATQEASSPMAASRKRWQSESCSRFSSRMSRITEKVRRNRPSSA